MILQGVHLPFFQVYDKLVTLHCTCNQTLSQDMLRKKITNFLFYRSILRMKLSLKSNFTIHKGKTEISQYRVAQDICKPKEVARVHPKKFLQTKIKIVNKPIKLKNSMKMSVGTKLSRFCNILSKCRSSIPPHRHFIVPSATKFKTFEPDYLDVWAANRNLIFF